MVSCASHDFSRLYYLLRLTQPLRAKEAKAMQDVLRKFLQSYLFTTVNLSWLSRYLKLVSQETVYERVIHLKILEVFFSSFSSGNQNCATSVFRRFLYLTVTS